VAEAAQTRVQILGTACLFGDRLAAAVTLQVCMCTVHVHVVYGICILHEVPNNRRAVDLQMTLDFFFFFSR
jgi:hypothetical protein